MACPTTTGYCALIMRCTLALTAVASLNSCQCTVMNFVATDGEGSTLDVTDAEDAITDEPPTLRMAIRNSDNGDAVAHDIPMEGDSSRGFTIVGATVETPFACEGYTAEVSFDLVPAGDWAPTAVEFDTVSVSTVVSIHAEDHVDLWRDLSVRLSWLGVAPH
jgi:hypothetical protein